MFKGHTHKIAPSAKTFALVMPFAKFVLEGPGR